MFYVLSVLSSVFACIMCFVLYYVCGPSCLKWKKNLVLMMMMMMMMALSGQTNVDPSLLHSAAAAVRDSGQLDSEVCVDIWPACRPICSVHIILHSYLLFLSHTTLQPIKNTEFHLVIISIKQSISIKFGLTAVVLKKTLSESYISIFRFYRSTVSALRCDFISCCWHAVW